MTAVARRELLRAGAAALAAGGGAVLVARAPAADAQSSGDPALLYRAVEAQELLLVVCDVLLARGGLGGGADAVSAIRMQTAAHVALLRSSISEIGGTLPGRPSVAEVEGVLPALRTVAGERAMLSLLAEVQRLVLHRDFGTVQELSDDKLVQRMAEVLGDEGEHLVVLRTLLGQDPLPFALESGQAGTVR